MNKLWMVLVLLIVSGLLAGCQTPVQTASERDQRIIELSRQEVRMWTDDWDYFWLVDHNTRLSPWHVDIGY